MPTGKKVKKQVLLALETSSPSLSVALKAGTRPPLTLTMRGYLKHTENLLPMIDRLLRRAGLKTSDISTFLLGRGPGSFTGLRVGYATIKGFMAVRKKPCYGALSLDMIAEGVEGRAGGRLMVASDARRSKVYCRLYSFQRRRWAPEGPLKVLLFPDFVEHLEPGLWLTGDVLERYRDVLMPVKRERKLRFLPRSKWYPGAAALAECFSRTGRTPKLFHRLSDPEDWIPLYFRLSEAEEKRVSHA